MFEKKLKPSSTEDFITTNTKKHCFISLQQRLKTVFFILFFNLLIDKSTNWQIDKSANRLFLQLIKFFDVFFYYFGHILNCISFFLFYLCKVK